MTRSARRGVVCFSSGNHAQAIALAGQLQGVPVTMVMPTDAPAMKAAATQGYGAEIVFYDRYADDREAITRQLAADRGLALLPPFDHPDIIAGQGTAAKELIEEVGPLDALLVCLGGGGLLPAARSPPRRCRPSSSGLASSRRPAMTGSVRSGRARSSASRCPARSPTAR